MKLYSMAILLYFVLFPVSSALDISIISYHDTNITTADASSSSRHIDNEVNDTYLSNMYLSWLVKHDKIYHTLGEKEKRFQIFRDNLRYIEHHNSGDNSYKLGLNKFADTSNEEYRLLYTRPKKIESKRKLNNVTTNRYSIRLGDVLPDSVDWRTKGAIVAIKDQGQCMSCWAFSTVGTVEAINQIVTGDPVTLSEQDLVDCDTYNNEGCNGGYKDRAFKFIVKNGGIHADKDYPYTGKDGRCKNTRKSAKIVSIDGYEDVSFNNESALQKATARQPVSVSIDASSSDFQFYASGIFDGSCGTDLDHEVIVVGYGTEDGKNYWIVRNSWGVDWGEQGYIRMERNVQENEGKCGIAMEASYPIKNGFNPPTNGFNPPTKRASILVSFLFSFLLNFVLSLA